MIPERHILVYVAAMITGIILVMLYDAVRKLTQLIQSHKVEYQNVQSPNLLSHLFSITGMPAGNYLVWLPRRVAMDTILVLQNSAGQYFRINPVSRP